MMGKRRISANALTLVSTLASRGLLASERKQPDQTVLLIMTDDQTLAPLDQAGVDVLIDQNANCDGADCLKLERVLSLFWISIGLCNL